MKTGSNSLAVPRSKWAAVLVVVAVCGLLAVTETLGDGGRALLRYDRAGVERGEWWRLLTGHFAHLGWRHVVLNCAGLALMAAIFARHYGLRAWLVIAATSVASIDIAFYWFEPRLQWYLGLSGVLHGVMAAGTVACWQRGERGAWILIVFLLGKLVWEQWLGPLPSSQASTGGAVVVDAHLYGALGGALAAFGLSLRRRWRTEGSWPAV